MKKTVNQILALLLTVVMLLGVVPMTGITATAATQSGTCGDELTWTFNESTGELKIDGTGAMYAYDGCLPPWVSFLDSIKTVTIGNNVTTIGDSAFYGCDSLTSVTIGKKVNAIGWSAFTDCDSLTSVTIPDSVTTIGDWAFDSCANLTSVAIGNSVTTIGYYAFSGTSLTSVTIPDSVTTIGWNGFGYCKSLTNITIGNNVATIGGNAFWGCDSLKSVIIGNSVTTIGSAAFANCNSLTSIEVATDNQYYSSDSLGVLYNKNKTELIQYPIGNKSTEFIILDSVTSIREYAFYSCYTLTDVYYNGTEEEWNKIEIGEENDPLFNATIHFNETLSGAAGDVNGDRKINSSDALVCLQHSVEKITLTGTAFVAGDVDKNGKINSTDALKILQFAVGKIEKL